MASEVDGEINKSKKNAKDRPKTKEPEKKEEEDDFDEFFNSGQNEIVLLTAHAIGDKFLINEIDSAIRKKSSQGEVAEKEDDEAEPIQPEKTVELVKQDLPKPTSSTANPPSQHILSKEVSKEVSLPSTPLKDDLSIPEYNK